MKRFTLGMLALGSLVLAGCSSDNTEQPTESEVRAWAVFNVATGDIPLPNDLLFSGTQDLTLNIPVADPNDYSDPQNAISALDGWSTVAPFAFSFDHVDDTVVLDASSVSAGSSVRIFEVLADTDYNNPLNGVSPTFAPYGLVGEVPNTEYVVQASGMSVAIVPLKPLNPRSTYLVVATNDITANGVNVTMDTQYDIVRSDETLTGSLEPLTPVQTLVNIYEDLAAAAGVDKESIVLTFAFTTQSVGDVMASAKGFYVDFPIQYFDPTGQTPGFPTTPQYPATSFSPLFTDTTPFTGQGAADLYKGEITLKYLLETPEMDPLAPITGFWKGAAMVPDGQGGFVPNPLAGGHVTYVNSLPEKNADEVAPLMVSIPKASLGCAKPAEGYPVLIFQHGITGNRTQMLGMADSMAAPPMCTAVISMDLPLHGIAETNAVHQGLQAASGGLIGIWEDYDAGDVRERTFGIDFMDNTTSAPMPDGTPDASGAHFINLPSLLTSRDNLRQAVLDLLTLKSAIPAMDIDGDSMPDFNPSEVSFFGISLGGIVGSNFTAYVDETTHFSVPSIVTSPMINTSNLAVPGGGIVGLLDASEAFGPIVRGGVAAAAGMEVTDAAFPALYQQFMFAAQTVIDSGDPINTTDIAIANNVPTFMIRVEGDSVVPNNSPTAPLSGTDPLAAYLGLQTVAVDNAGEAMVGSRLISRFNQGLHGTSITPNDEDGNPTLLAVTMEMQRQIASFIASDGTAVVVNDPTMLD